MANEYVVNSADMTRVADAIRSKGSTSDALSFPDGFVSAVSAIQTGTGGGSSNLELLHTETITQPVSAVSFDIPDAWKRYDALLCIPEDVVLSEEEWLQVVVGGQYNYLGIGGTDDGVMNYGPGRAEILVVFWGGKAYVEERRGLRKEMDISQVNSCWFAPYYNYNTINSGRFKIVGCKF